MIYITNSTLVQCAHAFLHVRSLGQATLGLLNVQLMKVEVGNVVVLINDKDCGIGLKGP